MSSTRERELLLKNGNMLTQQNDQLLNITRTLDMTHQTAMTTAVQLKDQERKIVVIHRTV